MALVGAAMVMVYSATEVLFLAWMIVGPGRSRLGLAMGLILQSLMLMGAVLQLFEVWLLVWGGGPECVTRAYRSIYLL